MSRQMPAVSFLHAAALIGALLIPGWTRAEDWTKPGEVKLPAGKWQVPGEIKQPTGKWQEPGEIQIPRGIQAIKSETASACESRLLVSADALFEFDKSELSADAEETLRVLGPLVAEKNPKSIRLEGHTDSKGSDDYNQRLSEERARAVEQWISKEKITTAPVSRAGFGERKPVAPNEKPDGSDSPEGRQKNRRVEIVLSTCG